MSEISEAVDLIMIYFCQKIAESSWFAISGWRNYFCSKVIRRAKIGEVGRLPFGHLNPGVVSLKPRFNSTVSWNIDWLSLKKHSHL